MIRRVRLISGLILFVYVTTHLFNHTFGLASYQAMEDARSWFLAGWRNPIGTVLLYGAITVYFILAFWALYLPRRLWLPPGEMGYGRANSVTTIGDTVNTASQLEEITKGFGAQLIVSRQVAYHAGIDLSGALDYDVPVRGRSTAISVYVVEDARNLPLEDPALSGNHMTEGRTP